MQIDVIFRHFSFSLFPFNGFLNVRYRKFLRFIFANISAGFQKVDMMFFQGVACDVASGRYDYIAVGFLLNGVQIRRCQTVFEVIVRNAVFVLAEKDCLLFVLFYPLFPQNIVMIMFAIVFDKGKCVLPRRNARIFRTEKVVVKLLQNSAVIHFCIQSLVILFTDIYIFAAKRIKEFRFDVNLIVVLENLFRRLPHKICFELFKFFLNAVYYKFFVIR